MSPLCRPNVVLLLCLLAAGCAAGARLQQPGAAAAAARAADTALAVANQLEVVQQQLNTLIGAEPAVAMPISGLVPSGADADEDEDEDEDEGEEDGAEEEEEPHGHSRHHPKHEHREEKHERREDKHEHKDQKHARKEDKRERKEEKQERKEEKQERKGEKQERKEDKQERKEDKQERKEDKAERKEDKAERKEAKQERKEDKRGGYDHGQHSYAEQPSKCSSSRISQVKCWLDKKGYVTGLAFEDEEGVVSPGMCSADGQHTDGGILDDGESIVEVVACKGPKGGYQYIEFHTDGGREQPITCGFGHDTRRIKGVSAAIEQPGKCELLSSGKTPKWTKQPSKWYQEVGYGMDTYSVAGQTLAKASAVDPMTGETASEYEVPPYYKEVFPLADLKARCNKKGELTKLENACWNDEYKPGKASKSLVVLGMTVELDRQEEEVYAPTCPGAARLEELRVFGSSVVQHILHKKDCGEAEVKSAVLNCKPQDETHNTTVSIIVTVDAAGKKSKKEIEEAVHRYSLKYEDDLCELPTRYSCGRDCSLHIDCDGQQVDSVSIDDTNKGKLPRGVHLTGVPQVVNPYGDYGHPTAHSHGRLLKLFS